MQLNRITLLPFSAAHYCLLGCILLITVTPKVIADSVDATLSAHEPSVTKHIVVTIKPLYSLVSHLVDGVHEPALLLKNVQTPHHYAVRPSERKLLAKADIIIWLGPKLEPQLNKIIQQQRNQVNVVSAARAKNLKLLNKRSKHSHDEDSTESISYSTHNRTDPHIWLSAHNAAQISKHICTSLITLDPDNTARYQQNLARLLKKIEHTQNAIQKNLDGMTQPFLVSHDAFQYFEDEYKLNYIDSISYGEETGSSLKHLQEIKDQINKMDIQCLVYQPPKPGIIDTLSRETTIKPFELDPLGLNLDDDKNAWFEIMQKISTNFSTCLTP